MTSRNDWLPAAVRELADLRGRDGAWGYARGEPGCVEPTALAALALMSTGPKGWDRRGGTCPDPVGEAAGWLTTVQRPDGSLGVSAGLPAPGWVTPYALLVWSAVGRFEVPVRRAVAWLLGQKGTTIAPADDPERIAGHDTTLVGWPWVGGTHSWLEPTAVAVLALGRAGAGDHPRVREGLVLIRDRAVEGGGWNYGNKAVFGRSLRPQPAPTGLALLALAGTGPRDAVVGRAVRYLGRALPNVRASASLGWGLLGLRAWGPAPEGSDGWLAAAYRSVTGRPDAAPRLAPLILAADDGSLALFGKS
jgi:hypothetical protein